MHKKNVIRIGMTAPLTGPASESGIALKEGATLAVEEINAAGGAGLSGSEYPIELYVKDSESKPDVGVSAAEDLITQDKVHYLIGDALHSSVTMAIMDLAPKYRIPIVSGEPVSEAIVDKVVADPERYQYYWKMDFGSTAYAHAIFNMVEWLLEKEAFQPRARRIGFIVEDTDYGRSNAQAAAELFERIGWSAPVEIVPLDQTEFGPELAKLRDAEVDVLVSIFTPVSSGAALVKQSQDLGVKALHIAIYYPNEPDFVQQAGDAAEGLLWTPLDFDPEHNSAHRAFSGKMQEKLQIEATYDHAFGYDALNNAVDSIGRAGSLKPKEIVDAVALLDRQGIVGRYVFDPTTHQAKAGPEFIPVPIAQIQGGESLIIWPAGVAAAGYQPQSWIK